MHVMLSWDIAADGPQWSDINNQLLAALQPHGWVRPLRTVYVLTLGSEVERQSLQGRLVAVAKANTVAVRLLISPLMAGGQYNGYLAADAWPKINARTTS